MLTALFLLSIAALSAAKLDNIGPCGRNIATDPSFDFDKYNTEHKGVWKFLKVTATKFNSDLASLKAISTPTDIPGVYNLLITYKTKEGVFGTFANETTSYKDGVVIAKGRDYVYSLKIFFIKYVPNRYAYYFICSDDGGDKYAEYRYVVGHGDLKTVELKDIATMEKQHGFKGDLIDLP